jgi:hypothetical protein
LEPSAKWHEHNCDFISGRVSPIIQVCLAQWESDGLKYRRSCVQSTERTSSFADLNDVRDILFANGIVCITFRRNVEIFDMTSFKRVSFFKQGSPVIAVHYIVFCTRQRSYVLIFSLSGRLWMP